MLRTMGTAGVPTIFVTALACAPLTSWVSHLTEALVASGAEVIALDKFDVLVDLNPRRGIAISARQGRGPDAFCGLSLP